MTNIKTSIFVAFLSVFSPCYADICDQVSKEKSPTAFLLNPDNQLNQGPIDFGKHVFSTNTEDEYKIRTGFMLITTPAKNKLLDKDPPLGFLRLQQKKSLCKNSNLYDVYYVFRVRDSSDRSWMPMRVDDKNVGLPNFEDLNNGGNYSAPPFKRRMKAEELNP